MAVHRPACMHHVALFRLQHLHPHPALHHPIMGAARRLKCAANLLAPTQPRRNAMRAKWPATAVPRVRRSTGVSNRTATTPNPGGCLSQRRHTRTQRRRAYQYSITYYLVTMSARLNLFCARKRKYSRNLNGMSCCMPPWPIHAHHCCRTVR